MPQSKTKKRNEKESTLDFAIDYANHGFRLFPVHTMSVDGACTCRKPKCTSPAKHPVARLAPNGVKDATNDLNTLKAWFGNGVAYNIGIATGAASGIVVLDIDPRHGGHEVLQKLKAKHGKLPMTLRFKTGGGGEHILFRNPGGVIRNSAGMIGSGIDVRGDGGYIVAPPSRHASGGSYSLPNGMTLDKPLATIPPWLLELIQDRQSNRANFSANSQGTKKLSLKQVVEGQRNNAIASLSGHLLGRQVPPDICLSLMRAFNEARCVPPLNDDEVVRTVSSIDRLAFSKIKTTR